MLCYWFFLWSCSPQDPGTLPHRCLKSYARYYIQGQRYPHNKLNLLDWALRFTLQDFSREVCRQRYKFARYK